MVLGSSTQHTKTMPNAKRTRVLSALICLNRKSVTKMRICVKLLSKCGLSLLSSYRQVKPIRRQAVVKLSWSHQAWIHQAWLKSTSVTMSTTFVNHLPEYCPVMLVSGASNMGRFDMNSNSVRRVFNMLLCPFQVKSRPSSFNISGPSDKCFLWVATQQTCKLIICKTIENSFSRLDLKSIIKIRKSCKFANSFSGKPRD